MALLPPLQIDPRNLISEDRHRSVAKIQRTDVVEAEHVVDMAVRDEHGVEPVDLRPQRLLPKVDGRIDKDLIVVVLEQDGDPQTLVARIV